MNKCLDCGKECKKVSKRCVLCSNAMNQKRTKDKNRKVFKKKECVVCNSLFVPYTEKQKTCTITCRQKHKNDVSNQNWLKIESGVSKYGKKEITQQLGFKCRN